MCLPQTWSRRTKIRKTLHPQHRREKLGSFCDPQNYAKNKAEQGIEPTALMSPALPALALISVLQCPHDAWLPYPEYFLSNWNRQQLSPSRQGYLNVRQKWRCSVLWKWSLMCIHSLSLNYRRGENARFSFETLNWKQRRQKSQMKVQILSSRG